jgi:hypothetical protein
MVRACVTCIEESRNAEKVLVGKRERMRLFGKPGYRWKYNIEMDRK